MTSPTVPGSDRPVRPAPARRTLLVALASWALVPALPALAQQPPGFDTAKQAKIDVVSKDHVRLTGAVDATIGDMRFFADQIDSYHEEHRVEAQGNVVFMQGGNRLAADRAEFDTETRLGTFYNANGSAVLSEAPTRDMMGGKEPDVYYFGEKIEKIGTQKYKITRGGFTTCVQPTPRWQVTAATVILNLDHYAYLRNAVLRAKGVPVFYVPVLLYPIKKDDRATGFLMPSYGTSTLRGFTLSNAFFWAISRSQDATLMHDWFAKRGQGMGLEYRYIQAAGSQGFLRLYRLNEHEATYTDASGNSTTAPARKSYEVRGNLSQQLARGWFLRGRADYFSDVGVRQAYHTDIYDASSSQRTISAGLSGMFRTLMLNANYDRSELFSGTTTSAVTGTTPRVSISRGERPLFGLPLYVGATAEYSRLVRVYKAASAETDSSLGRADFQPTIRLPFTKLRWLTVNSSMSWRDTWWSRSVDPETDKVIDEPISRRYFEFSSRVVGPVFNKVWTTPANRYAEKFKHTIEPSVQLQRVTSVDNFDRIVRLDSGDFIMGGTTRINYGITNRFMAKRKGGARPGVAHEFLTITLSQTYYTDSQASQYDFNYSSSFWGAAKPSNFSPVSLNLRAIPTEQINVSLRAEYDPEIAVIRSLSASGQLALRDWVSVTGGYSQRRVEDSLTGAAVGTSAFRPAQEGAGAGGYRTFTGEIMPSHQENSVYGTANMRWPGNKIGGSYSFNYDIHHSSMLNSRFIAYYNAQCCGFAIEYQSFNRPYGFNFPIQQDNRFNFSFTLAGLGTFSNFFGALGGGSQR